MNFGELVEASIAQVVSLTQTDRLVNANENFVKAMVNQAYHKVERSALWKFSEAEATVTSAADTREAQSQPADLSVPLMLHDTEVDQVLEYHDERQKFHYLQDTGRPFWYSMWDGDIRLYPLPNKVYSYTLRYYKSWPDMVADSDEPLMPEAWHDLMVNYAAGKLAQRLPPTGDRFLPHSLAQPFLDQFEADLLRMKESPLVMKTWDAVPNYGFEDEVLAIQEW